MSTERTMNAIGVLAESVKIRRTSAANTEEPSQEDVTVAMNLYGALTEHGYHVLTDKKYKELITLATAAPEDGVWVNLTDAVERLAHVEHERWAGWQAYLHSKCECLEDGSLRIPYDLVQRWQLQIVTEYAELSEPEKESDRIEARKSIAALQSPQDGSEVPE